VLESLDAIHNDLLAAPKYSVQYLMDCDNGNFGCDGGWMTDAWEFTKTNGIVGWNDYPSGYTGHQSRCRDPGSSVK